MNKSSLSFRPVFLIAIMVFILAACLPSKPTEENIIGVWVERSTNGQKASQCGSFEFFEGGQFEANNIPREYFVPAGYDTPERIDAHGSWSLDTSSNDPFAVHRVVLLFSPIKWLPSKFEGVLYIAVGGTLLYSGIDDTVSFKQGEKCEK